MTTHIGKTFSERVTINLHPMDAPVTYHNCIFNNGVDVEPSSFGKTIGRVIFAHLQPLTITCCMFNLPKGHSL